MEFITKLKSRPANKIKGFNGTPPHFYFIISAIFHYLGPSFAVLLFTYVSVDGVAWMRIVSAALVFAIWRQPWRAFFQANRNSQMLILGLGITFAIMNYSFYYAIDSLPLGTVAAIEFLGPVTLAVIGTNTWRNLFALICTINGVYLLTDIRWEGETLGFFWAFTNAVCFTLYIILAHRLTQSDSATRPIDRLGASMLVAAIAITPLGFQSALSAFDSGLVILAGVGVGVSSSVIPYALDQLAMAKLSQATYALFVAILPATAVIIGVLVLQQIPTRVEVLAVGLVIVGVVVKNKNVRS